MALRCFLFSEDENTSALILPILEGLGLETESCADAVAAAEKIANTAFQIVIVDWDRQPEAAVMLNSARERKASERPLTLAVVSDDKSVPTVLQAGANSILRKPIVSNQATDTLKMARDLIRAKQDSAASSAQAAAAAAAAAASAPKTTLPPAESAEKGLRAGEFLQSAPPSPGAQFETDADLKPAAQLAAAEPVDPLKDLEPVASSVAEKDSEPVEAPREARGLEWYKNRLASLRPNPEASAAPAAAPPAPAPGAKAELLGFDQTPSFSSSAHPAVAPDSPASASKPRPDASHKDEQTKEAALFAYIDGERSESDKPARSGSGLVKKLIIAAAVLAAIAVAAAPQAPWHPRLQALVKSGHLSMHAWLNPQPVTPVQAPAAHENFAQAGDEYKLPTADPIPDATTDPSQIQVVPVVDPTAKKTASDASSPDQPTVVSPAPADQAPPQTVQPAAQIPDQPAQSLPSATPAPASPTIVPVSSPSPTVVTTSAPTHSEPVAVAPTPVVSTPAPKPQPRQPYIPGNVPSSLKSQLAPSTDAGGNKAPDAALPSIEPVQVSETAERALLSDSPAIPYPDNAKGQQGTVILQVLIARDGSVEDAKFLQGSLAFARNAIDGVKQWKFKPYVMNGRPVSVQTQLTMHFAPAQ